MQTNFKALATLLSFAGLVGCGSDVQVETPTAEESALVAPDNSAYCADSKKVAICHIPPGNPAAKHSICVGKAAEAAHLAHGDVLGACDGELDDGDEDDVTPPSDPPPACVQPGSSCTYTSQCCKGLTCKDASSVECQGGEGCLCRFPAT